MPVVQKWLFVCPLTGIEVLSDTPNLPERWAHVNGENYSPQGVGVIATRVLANPDASYEDITRTPYPDPTLDGE